MRTMAIICAGLVLLIALPVLIGMKLVGGKSDELDPDINSLVTNAVDEGCVGIIVGIIDAEGTKIYSAGKLKRDGDREVDADTLFEIASITKVFTSLVLQDMVDRGELELDDPVEKFLPPSVKVPSKNGKKITLRHLATHRSGLPRLPDNFKPKDKANPYADYTPEKLYEFLSSHKLSREPGEKYEYSNLGGDLLGLALSRKAGVDYETLIAQRICNPLKMNNTRIHLAAAQQTNFATGHDLFSKPVKHWDWVEPLGGAGALRSSMNDMLKFAAANLALTNSSLAHAMEKSHVRQEKGGLLSPDVGLGWHLQMEYKNKKFKWFTWHNGGTYGFSSYIALDKEHGRGVVVLANSRDVADDIGSRLIQDKLFAPKPPQLYPTVKVDSKLYDDYVGTYRFNEKKSLTITRQENRLFAQITGQSAVEIFPQTETEFFYKVVNAQLAFERNKAGAISAVILRQNGLDNRVVRSVE